MNLAATTALNRFGLGARFDLTQGARKAIAADPRGYLKSELQPERAHLNGADLDSSRINLLVNFAEQERKRYEREQGQLSAKAPKGVVPGPKLEPPSMAMGGKDRPIQRDVLLTEIQARWQKGFEDPSGFIERLVWFWSNHFAVSIGKAQQVVATAGAYEREAIRPHVLGKFGAMLKAVEQHPTMLFFLDNRSSVGPNSKGGLRQSKGLNENLAREILELHTLGVGGGYTQADVTNLARIITGWSWVNPNNNKMEPAIFVFNPNTHEPGDFKVLAKAYAQGDQTQGEAVLNDLALHPTTAKHLATKFVRHFVADDPPPALVAKLTKVYLDTGGDLAAFTKALIDDDTAWSAPATKLRLPQEYFLATARAINFVPDKPEKIVRVLNDLGQPTWRPSGPNGFGDKAQDWASAEGLKMRFAWSANLASQATLPSNPSELASVILGDTASQETTQAIARAQSKAQGLALLLMSPEFQRR